MTSTLYIVQKPPTKADIRLQINKAVADYLKNGGEIHQVPNGVSGRNPESPLYQPLFDTPKTTRTYVTDLIADIDARRKPDKPKPRSTTSKPREKVILDDFGEPIRKVWVEE